MSDQSNREEIFSKPVRAGKRTYFFDVKATRGRDLYMTITESKRRFDDDGNVHYQKHKIFLYREDFQNFEEGFKPCLLEMRRTASIFVVISMHISKHRHLLYDVL